MYTTGPAIYDLLISVKAGIQDGTESLPVSGHHCARLFFTIKFQEKNADGFFCSKLNEAKNQKHKNSNGGN